MLKSKTRRVVGGKFSSYCSLKDLQLKRSVKSSGSSRRPKWALLVVVLELLSCRGSKSSSASSRYSYTVVVLTEANYESDVLKIASINGGLHFLGASANDFNVHLAELKFVCFNWSEKMIDEIEKRLTREPYIRSVKVRK